jgi:hypothetical protein
VCESHRENFFWERTLARDIMKTYSDAFVVTQKEPGHGQKSKEGGKEVREES